MKDPFLILQELRKHSGKAQTIGIDDASIKHFIQKDPLLVNAINQAEFLVPTIQKSFDTFFEMEEQELCNQLQDAYVNFYPANTRNPYVPLSAAGPWIISTHGAVIHDSGGYGMLGLGHNSKPVLDAISEHYVMANVMTPSLSQKRFSDRLKKEIGHTSGGCPFHGFICMNSGSESISVASRICDIHTSKQTQAGGKHAGKTIRQLTLAQSFHGRTYRAAQVSDSTLEIYKKHLASFKDRHTLDTVPPNDLDALRLLFEQAEKNNIYYEAFYIEPVMGEGVAGLAITREFYDLARALTEKHDTLFIVDSIQAAFRATGALSIIDYPGFSGCTPPDCETYSKALNAGQYPLSVLALNKKMAELYVPGVYGNTMTTNPRALEVGCTVLDGITDTLRKNIRERGVEFKEKLEHLAEKYPACITKVVGTGLMLLAELNPETHPVVEDTGFEYFMRTHGIEMIHGGENGLRFTPHFAITSDEIDLIIQVMEKGFSQEKH